MDLHFGILERDILMCWAVHCFAPCLLFQTFADCAKPLFFCCHHCLLGKRSRKWKPKFHWRVQWWTKSAIFPILGYYWKYMIGRTAPVEGEMANIFTFLSSKLGLLKWDGPQVGRRGSWWKRGCVAQGGDDDILNSRSSDNAWWKCMWDEFYCYFCFSPFGQFSLSIFLCLGGKVGKRRRWRRPNVLLPPYLQLYCVFVCRSLAATYICI